MESASSQGNNEGGNTTSFEWQQTNEMVSVILPASLFAGLGISSNLAELKVSVIDENAEEQYEQYARVRIHDDNGKGFDFPEKLVRKRWHPAAHLLTSLVRIPAPLAALLQEPDRFFGFIYHAELAYHEKGVELKMIKLFKWPWESLTLDYRTKFIHREDGPVATILVVTRDPPGELFSDALGSFLLYLITSEIASAQETAKKWNDWFDLQNCKSAERRKKILNFGNRLIEYLRPNNLPEIFQDHIQQNRVVIHYISPEFMESYEPKGSVLVAVWHGQGDTFLSHIDANENTEAIPFDEVHSLVHRASKAQCEIVILTACCSEDLGKRLAEDYQHLRFVVHNSDVPIDINHFFGLSMKWIGYFLGDREIVQSVLGTFEAHFLDSPLQYLFTTVPVPSNCRLLNERSIYRKIQSKMSLFLSSQPTGNMFEIFEIHKLSEFLKLPEPPTYFLICPTCKPYPFRGDIIPSHCLNCKKKLEACEPGRYFEDKFVIPMP